MAKVVKKKKKKLGKRSFSGGGGREQSPLRPKHVEKKPPCSDTCPSGNAIRSFITTIAQAEKKGKSQQQAAEEAWFIYTNTSPFPSVCGRVCPAPCEQGCNRNNVDDFVGINSVERYIGDYAIEHGLALGEWVLAAGLDGIVQHIDCGDQAQGEFPPALAEAHVRPVAGGVRAFRRFLRQQGEPAEP